MLINKSILINKFFYLLLFLSFLHAILRLDDTSSFSLYRILMPVSFIMLAFAWKPLQEKIYILMLILFYNFVISFLYTSNLIHYSVMALHYLSIFNIYLIVYYLYEKDGFYNIYIFLYRYIILTLVIAISEMIFGFRLPNTAIYFDGSVSAFNWNQNEYGAILLSFIPFLLVYTKNILSKLLMLFLILYINYINDSKLVLIGTVFAIILYNLKKNVFELHLYIKRIGITVFVTVFVIIFFLPYDEIYISFRDYSISLYDLFGMPISHILTLTPFPDIGESTSTRANAIIYALLEFKNSYFCGIGIGNTLTMLEKPEFSLKAAKSIHNFPIQLIVENGIWVLFIYIYLLYLFIKLFIKQNLTNIELVVFVAIPSIFIGTMGSSVGIFSDYFLFASIFLMAIHYKKEIR